MRSKDEFVNFLKQKKMNDYINAIIVDLDGTLCDCNHRRHFVEGGNKDWIANDKVNEWCKELLIAMYLKGYKIIFFDR